METADEKPAIDNEPPHPKGHGIILESGKRGIPPPSKGEGILPLPTNEFLFPEELLHREGENGKHFYMNPQTGGLITTDERGRDFFNTYRNDLDAAVETLAEKWKVPPGEIEKRLGKFLDTLKQRRLFSISGGKKPPIPFMASVLFEVTYRCNFKCKGCDANAYLPRENELSTEELKKLIDTFIELDASPISFTGGEPLLRDDIFELYEYIHSKGGQPVLATNGALVTPEIARKLKELKVFVQVGLDGSNAEINDANRGEGSFEKAIRGIETLHREGVPFRISTVVTKQNHADLGNVADLASQLGSTAVVFRKMHVLGRAPEHPEVVPNAKEMIAAFKIIFNKTLEYRGRMAIDLPYHRAFFGGRGCHLDKIMCIPGYANVVISPEGNIHPCARLRDEEYLLGNIRDKDVGEIWENCAANRKIRELTVDDIHCSDCRYRHLCGGSCRAEAFYRSGGVEKECWDCDAIKAYYDEIIEYFLSSMEPITP